MKEKTIEDLFDRNKKYTLRINVHGTVLRFYCAQKGMLNHIELFLQYFAGRGKKAGDKVAGHCMLNILTESEYRRLGKIYTVQKTFEAFPGMMAKFGNHGDLSVYEIKSSCLIIINNITNECACVLKRTSNKKLINIDYVVHILLVEWLRGMGSFFIHSAGLCRKKDAFLFIGQSGAGKTTTSLIGIQHGLSFMGDDLLIVRDTKKGVMLYSYIEDVKFCLDMTGKFAALAKSKALQKKADNKVASTKFDVRKYFKVNIAASAKIKKICFLNKGDDLVRIPLTEALPMLMNNSFYFTREGTSAKHFDILCKLLESVECYAVGHGYINNHFSELTAN